MGSAGRKAPSLRPATAPVGPVATATAAAGSASIATVMSAASVTSFGLLASCAPAHGAPQMAPWRAIRSWLAGAMRLAHCAPMW